MHDTIVPLLRRLHYLRKTDQLEPPIAITEGEDQHSTTSYYYIATPPKPSPTLLAIKEFHSEQATDHAWNIVDRQRAAAKWEALLPIPDNARSDRIMVYADGEHLFKVLRSLKLLHANEVFPRRTELSQAWRDTPGPTSSTYPEPRVLITSSSRSLTVQTVLRKTGTKFRTVAAILVFALVG